MRMSLPWVRIAWRTGVETRKLLKGATEALVLKFDDGHGNVVLWTDKKERVTVRKNKVMLERLDK